MKYIIVDHQGLELAIMFDEILTHQQIAGVKPVISAGFCSAGGAFWGQSVSLGIKSRPQDGEVIKQSMSRTI